MSDQDPTPEYQRRVQTSEDRDLAARRTRPRTPANPLGIKIYRAPEASEPAAAGELTSPFELLEREPDHEVQAVVERSPRNAKDPAYFEDVAKLAVALNRERTGNRQRERDAEEVLREPVRAARGSRRGLIATAIAAALSLGGAIDHRLSRPVGDHTDAARELHELRELREHLQQQDAVREQLRQQERDQYKRDIERLDAELRALREQLGRRSELDPQVSAGREPALTVSTQGLFP